MRGKSNFIFNEKQVTYTIQLKRRFKWWYLLPLLLLLLLIKCNQTIEYQAIDADTKTPLENTQVNVVISDLNFEQSQSTNEKGKTKFSIGKYPIYKLLFTSFVQNVTTSASHVGYKNASFSDMLKSLNKKLNIIELEKVSLAQIIVIDSISREPIQGITVILETGNLNQSKISNVNGAVVFDSIYFENNSEAVVSTQSTDYEDVRRYYQIQLPETINDTIALLAIDDGGLRGERGDITINLSWESTDDLDLYLKDPCGNQIYFDKRSNECNGGSGYLDLDANADEDSLISNPQENIYWNSPSAGEYLVYVHFYKRNELRKVPFTVTVILKNERYVIDSIAPAQDKFVIVDTIKID